jgi:hypothetical protein
MENKTYAEKLKDPRWQKKRLEIFQRDQFRCMECFSDEKSLQVHHIAYKGKNPWDTPNNFLITYCEGCHKNEEEKLKALGEKFIKIMRNDSEDSRSIDFFISNMQSLMEKELPHRAAWFLSLAIIDEKLLKYISDYITANFD